MTNKSLRSKYKGIKWINTRYAKAFIFRMGWMTIQKLMIVQQARAQMFRIRATKADTFEAKAAKAQAMVSTVENTVKALKSVK